MQVARVADPVSETPRCWYSRGRREEFARVLGRGSVVDPRDDPVLVEAVPEFEERAVELRE